MRGLVIAVIVAGVGVSSCAIANRSDEPTYEPLFEAIGVPHGTTLYVLRQPAVADVDAKGEFAFPDRPRPHDAAEFGSFKVHFVERAEYDELFAAGSCGEGWENFHHRYPEAHALLGVSNFGHRADSGEVAVYLETGGACLGGSAWMFILDKSSGAWKIKHQEMVWIS